MARILVVDDDRDIRQLLSISLSLAGHQVEEAADSPTALSMGTDGDFDLVMLDVNVPPMSGMEVARRLRALQDRPLILMLSALATAGDTEAGLAAGADAYVTKPFHLSHLTNHVDRMLTERQGW